RHLELEVAHREELALEGHGPARQDPPQDGHVLAHRPDRPLVRLTVPAGDVVARLHAEAEQQPAAGELVQRDRLERHRHRRAAPDPDDAGAEQERLRPGRSRRGGAERVAERDLGEPGGPEPGLLDAAAVVDRQARRQRLDEEVEPVHDRTAPAGSDAPSAKRRASGAPGLKIWIGTSENGMPPSFVTSQVSCMYRHDRSSAVIACGCMETTMFSRSSTSMPSPIRGCSIIVIPIEWPVTCPSVKPRSRNGFEIVVCTSCAVAPSRIVSFASSKYSR